MSARKEAGFVAGIRVVTDERMGRDQVAMVNEDGVGIVCEDGEFTPFITEPMPPAIRLARTEESTTP